MTSMFRMYILRLTSMLNHFNLDCSLMNTTTNNVICFDVLSYVVHVVESVLGPR